MLGQFVFKKFKCAHCKVEIKETDGAVCSKCVEHLPKYFSRQRLKTNYYERIYADYWNECQRCQGSLINNVICQNSDCPIFYKRLKAKKDLNEELIKLNYYNKHLSNW